MKQIVTRGELFQVKLDYKWSEILLFIISQILWMFFLIIKNLFYKKLDPTLIKNTKISQTEYLIMIEVLLVIISGNILKLFTAQLEMKLLISLI
jgi:hypothetical protein